MTTISALPTPPSRADSPADFSAKADALLGALPTFVTQTNTVASEVNTAKNNAATSEANAATSAGTATSAASTATTAATNAAAAYDAFDDRYLGSFAVNPTLDNDGNALLVGAMYWNTAATELRIWTGSAWVGSSVPGGTVPVSSGGTGSTTADAARAALKAVGQDGTEALISGVAGTNTITGSLTPALTAYVAGQTFRFVSAGANTGATTININGLGAKSITKNGTTALEAGDIASGAAIQIQYDGTQFQLTSGAGGGAKAGGVLYENATTISANYTLGTGKNAMTVGPMTVASGVTLTIPSGQRLVVL